MSDNPYSIPNPKVDPGRRPARRPDNTPDDDNRIEIGPTPLAYTEWQAAGLQCPDLPAMRQYRLDRIVAGLIERKLDAVLLFDPLSIRYATDTTNMQLWNAHNPFRACMVTADGYMLLWEYGGYAYMSEYNPLVREVRAGASFFYFATGQRTEEKAEKFAEQVVDVLKQRTGSGKRLAVDKIQIDGLRALDAKGIHVEDGEELMERTRAIKGPDEILAMRCAIQACEASIAEMREFAEPGVTENDIWAELHKSNIRRGGEWIETRLLSTGQRTNPWFLECGPRVLQNNEILAFDTDLIGCYGMCTDISRSWFIGDGQPTQRQKDMHKLGYEHIMANAELVAPGVSFQELTEGGHQLPEKYIPQRYGSKFHGVGLCDEWPAIKYPIDWQERGYAGVLEPGMMLCVEAYIGEVGGPDGIKLEDQLLVTEDGFENMVKCPFDALLMG
ncbi:MAG: aminopeptidase P family protein [Gammaproteobacteria bacterium]|nr:aminopeptidase P family protein [Gammaproteobacteria bacterium]